MLIPPLFHAILKKTLHRRGLCMAIDVTIKQKLFGSKTMPLEVILGDNLHYGYWENDQLTEGKLGETEFIAYDPNAIGRGFSIIWNPGEKKAISLRLPIPSTTPELRAFYDCVTRMVNYWGGTLTVDGSRVKPDAFLAGFDDMTLFNNKIIGQISQQILNGENENLTIYSAKWPLTIGAEEAEAFMADSSKYTDWLHEKQSMDVFFCNPRFYANEAGILGQFMLMNDLPTVFPVKPTVPFGLNDPSTGQPLKCSNWRIVLVIEHQKEPLCEMDYDKFLNLIPAEKKIRYDANHFLLSELTEHELRTLADV